MSLRGTGRGRRWWIRLGWCTSRCLERGLGEGRSGVAGLVQDGRITGYGVVQ